MKVQKVLRGTGEVVETMEINAEPNEIAGKPFICVYGDVRPRKTEGYELIEKSLGCGLKAYVRFEVNESFMSKFDKGLSGSFVVNTKNIGFLGMNEDELWQRAIENMKEWGLDLKTMGQFLFGLMGLADQPFGDFDSIYVARLNAHGGQYGAGILGMPCLLDVIRDKIGDFVILPASVHEIICIPTALNGDLNEFCEMVRFVNSTEVELDDKLSDAVFIYDSEGLHKA